MASAEVALLAPLDADLAEEHNGEEGDVEKNHIEPELIGDWRWVGKLGETPGDRFAERLRKYVRR